MESLNIKKTICLILVVILLPFLCSAETVNKIYLHLNKTEITCGEKVKVYGHVKPRKEHVSVRIFYKTTDGWAHIKTKKTSKKGNYHFHATPEQDTYYRAKIKVNRKWAWGSKKKFINVEEFIINPDPIINPYPIINPDPTLGPTPDPEVIVPYATCGVQNEWFNQSILTEGVYHSISPLGAVNPSGHSFPTDHIYYYFNDYLTVSNVYAPGEIYVESVTAQEHLSASPAFTDYTVRFRPCTEIHGFFMHMSGISSGLEEAYNQVALDPDYCNEYSTGGENYRICTKEFSYKFLSGEIVGTAGGNAGQYALDWGLYDTRLSITGVANQSRWYESTLYNVCPLDYYDTTNKNLLYSYLGYMENKRTVEPLCGTINQDVAATAQGRWFLSGTVGTSWQEDHQLALIHNNVNFAQGLFSVGDSVTTLATGTYTFIPAFSGNVNRDFDEVTVAGGVYCYDTNTKVILTQLLSDTSLRIESQELGSCGSGPWAFTNSYNDFER